MSLNVSPELLDRAKQDQVSDEDFIACIQKSLPYAWSVVSSVIEKANADGSAIDGTPPPSDDDQGQLLRLMASDAMREAIERHFGMRLAFQNCCNVGAFTPENDELRRTFVSPRAQLLNQSPALVNC